MKTRRRKFLESAVKTLALIVVLVWAIKPPSYDPIERECPVWFDDAKFGIFIHWSLFSVPAYAPTGRGDIWEVAATEGMSGQMKNNPYAEWYLNSLRIEGSPAQKYHRETYGKDFSYDDFVPVFNREINAWDPEQWAGLFEAAGAKYVVMVTKHHDGFLLWPSARPNPFKEGYAAVRDSVGELTRAVRAHGMKMGLYYSGGLDWTFADFPIVSPATGLANAPQSPAYAEYVMAHWRELIDRYQPDVLWNDICFPRRANLHDVFSHYYTAVPEGVVNDRWLQYPRIAGIATLPGVRSVVNYLGERFAAQHGEIPPQPFHADFVTPEYKTFKDIQQRKWETCRGIGKSFGYNRMETAADYLTAEEVIRLLADVVSKNGNLLLNVGPQADGTISPEQEACLRGIGSWLTVNGEAIYGTRPWTRAEGRTTSGDEIRFTQKGDSLFVILMDRPEQTDIEILDLNVEPGSSIRLLGHDGLLHWSQQKNTLKVALPVPLMSSPAYALEISSAGTP